MRMALESRIAELRQRHRNLEVTLERELHRAWTDNVQITKMKREKLRLKEEIGRLSPEH